MGSTTDTTELSTTAFTHHFKGNNGIPSWCRVIIARHPYHIVDVVMIGGTCDEACGEGASVTNASEYIAAGVWRDHLAGVPLARIRWFECYADELRVDHATGRIFAITHGYPAIDHVSYVPISPPTARERRAEDDMTARLQAQGVMIGKAPGPDVEPFGRPRWRPTDADERNRVLGLIERHLDDLGLDPAPLTRRDIEALEKERIYRPQADATANPFWDE